MAAPNRAFAAAVAAALIGYSAVAVSPVLYVPVNLAFAAALVAAARRLGLSWRELGMERRAASAGLRLGGAVALVAAAGLAVAVAVPALHPLLDDARVAGAGWGLIAYRALVRIPLGTALLEEVAFRGVLLAAWRRVSGTWPAVVGSSAVFGLWHVRPTLELLEANDVATGLAATAAAVSGAVLVTAAAGVFFCWLRLRSDSLAGPFVAHAAINSLALVAAFLVTG